MRTESDTNTPTPTDPDPWLTLQQAADERLCHEATLRRMIRAGVLRHARVGRKAIRLRRSWLDAAMDKAATPIESRG